MLTLYRVLYRIGSQTQIFQQKMQQFEAYSQSGILDVLKQFFALREYIGNSSSKYKFTTKIGNFLSDHSQPITATTTSIYQLMKEMDMLSQSLKYRVLSRITSNLMTNSNSIANEQLQQFLWLLHREYPYYQNLFEEAGQAHTLRLFDIQQYMNSIKVMPKWQPYIRVTHMLHKLGHQTQVRSDITQLKLLNHLNYKYMVLIAQIADKQSMLANTVEKHGKPYLVKMCQQYAMKNQFQYDRYLKKVQDIDNLVANEQIDRMYDTLQWNQFIDHLILQCIANTHCESYTTTQYRILSTFWRLLQTSPIPLQQSTKILQILADNPTFIQQKQQQLIQGTITGLLDRNLDQFYHYPATAMYTLLTTIHKLQLQPTLINNITMSMLKHVPYLKMWQKNDKISLKLHIQQHEYKVPNNIIQYLNKQ